MPDGGLHLWRWFRQLRRRSGGENGLGPITFQDVDAWNRLLRIGARPWEIETIMAIDDAYMAGHAGGE